jgi:lipoprotein-releasing system ATP-binding protein
MNETLAGEMVRERMKAREARTLLEGHALSKVYGDGQKAIRAVDGVSLRLARGESLALIGPSGAGKSTLLHLLGGLDTPTAGTVSLDGLDLYGMPEARRARMRNERIGFIFQFYHLLPEFTALENVYLPALIRTRSSRRARGKMREKAMGLLEAVGLKERISHKPQELSGGESQRVAIARALINDPDILLCDEPTGNLDSRTGEDVIGLLMEINARERVSLIVATHDESLKEKAGALVYIRDGKIIG